MCTANPDDISSMFRSHKHHILHQNRGVLKVNFYTFAIKCSSDQYNYCMSNTRMICHKINNDCHFNKPMKTIYVNRHYYENLEALSFILICGIRCRKAEAYVGYSRTAIGCAKIKGITPNIVLIHGRMECMKL